MRQGTIVLILNASSGLDLSEHPGDVAKYVLDTGFSWYDTAGRHAIGDLVRIEEYLMGTIRAVKLDRSSACIDALD